MNKYKLLVWIIILSSTVGFSQASVDHDVDKNSLKPRIISLAPSLTESIYLLDMGEYLVGNTFYCNKPEDAKNKPRVASAVDVNIEEVVRLKPDLVLATQLTDPRAIRKLKAMHINTMAFKQPYSFNQMAEQFLCIAKRLEREHLAKTIINHSRRKLEIITNRLNHVTKPSVFIQLGARPIFAATSESFVNDLVTYAKGVNIAENEKTGIYSREMLLVQNPDIILITSMGIKGSEEKKQWLKFRSLKAVQTNRIYIIDSELFCSPSVASFVDALKQLVLLLHPQVSWK